jgi:hypothetical protein
VVSVLPPYSHSAEIKRLHAPRIFGTLEWACRREQVPGHRDAERILLEDARLVSREEQPLPI